MARKNRKSQGRRPEPQPAAAAPEAGQSLPPQRARPLTGFNPDYTHVRRDLKRIGLLAGFFILAMVIGSILIR